jgi:hypothetical protein
MSEFEHHLEVQIGSEKNFGVVFSAVFMIIGLFPLLSNGPIRWWAVIIAGVFLMLAFLFPTVLRVPNRLWHKFGLLLGAIVAPVAMAVVFYVTVVPIGLIFKMVGKDVLHKKLDKKAESYWIEREQPVGTMKNQF